jgi:Flp pilus assembly protein CpaB
VSAGAIDRRVLLERIPAPLRRWADRLAWHKRLLAAALLALAVASALSVLAPKPPATVAVLAAARDLPAGTMLTSADLRHVHLAPSAVPAGTIGAADLVVRVHAGPVRRGEPLTDVRLVGRALVASLGAGTVATPVRIADPAAARLLEPGDVIDVLAASTRAGGAGLAERVATGVRVLAVPSPSDAAVSLDDGALVVLATTPSTAAVLARAAVVGRLSVTIDP